MVSENIFVSPFVLNKAWLISLQNKASMPGLPEYLNNWDRPSRLACFQVSQNCEKNIFFSVRYHKDYDSNCAK